jgi:hypothetical protein
VPSSGECGGCWQALTGAVIARIDFVELASNVSIHSELLGAFEDHSPDEIRRLLAAGASPTAPMNGKRPIDCLIEMYPRTRRFAECLQVMLDAGATTGDPLLEAILLDDDAALRKFLEKSAEGLHRRLTFVSAFTSCWRVTALHVCADFNSVNCARVLLESGADVNARADQTPERIGGQTPIFHAVNSIFNYCRPMMELLIDAGADLDVRVTALLWGQSMSWETIVYDVTPIAYAQCGLYRQFHRQEEHVYSNIEYLFTKRHGTAPSIRNVPNRYLVVGH